METQNQSTAPATEAVPAATVAPAAGISVADLINTLNRYGVDLRTLLLLVPAGGVFYIDEALAKALLFSMLFMGVFALMSHVLRKVFFPYVDTEKFSDAALANPVGAGLVFLGICLVIAASLIGSVIWMAH